MGEMLDNDKMIKLAKNKGLEVLKNTKKSGFFINNGDDKIKLSTDDILNIILKQNIKIKI